MPISSERSEITKSSTLRSFSVGGSAFALRATADAQFCIRLRRTKLAIAICLCVLPKFGLAPSRVYRTDPRGSVVCALLPHIFNFAFFALGEFWPCIFCGTFPRITPGQLALTALFYGVRTFLCANLITQRLSDLLEQYNYIILLPFCQFLL